MEYILRMKLRPLSVSLMLLILALIALIVVLSVQRGIEVSAPPPVILSEDDRSEAERIIRARINTLSTAAPKLGGRFEVNAIQWDARGRATVTYGDGESTLHATATVRTGSGNVKIEAFVTGE